MRYIINSPSLTILDEPTESKIDLYLQFFIHSNEERNNEIKTCLKMNVINPYINKIFLLNERIYTPEEMGVDNSKIIQIPLGTRLKYSDIFNWVNIRMNLVETPGYIIIANADIFFDETLENLLKSDMNQKPTIMAQLRYDYDGTASGIKIFGPRPDSQDCWIYHSKYNNLLLNKKIFNFELGMPGCDNSILYLFKLYNFRLINDPESLHCMHYHQTQIRNYSNKDLIKKPYVMINPPNLEKCISSDVGFEEDNELLYNYIKDKLENNKKFIIPRIAGQENIIAYDVRMYNEITAHRKEVMKSNAGVLLTNEKSCEKYSKKYLKAFKNCEIYSGWSSKNQDNVYNGIKDSHEFIELKLCNGKKKLWAESALEIYNYINYPNIWTTAFKGKRILVISSFIESIKKKIEIREKIYGVDLFPDCEFVFIKPPSLSGDNPSCDWEIEYNKFCYELDKFKNDYDVALVSCGGLGNLVCNYLYEQHNKSAIYIGGVLSVWFGVYNKRMLEEKPAILRMYLNEWWSRPMTTERPLGWEKIENGGCYW